MKTFAHIRQLAFSSPAYVASILIASILLWATGMPGWMHTANAAAVSDFSDVLYDSAPSNGSNHTITFTTANGVSAGGAFTVTFQAGFNMNSIDFADIDFFAGDENALAAAPSGATWGVGVSGNTITFTSGSDTVASSTQIVIEIGTNATTGGTGNTQIINPGTPGSYTVDTALPGDSGQTRVYIIDDVQVTAAVDSVFTFAIQGVANGVSVNGSSNTATSTTSTLIPFETLAPGTPKVLAQRINVTTNAANGYSVTIRQDQNLTSAVGADIDLFDDGATTSVPKLWEAPSNTFNQEHTYGHFGITSSDDVTSSSTAPAEWGTNLWAGNFNTPREVLYHNAPSSGLSATEGEGWAYVGFQAEIGTLQEAGNDYTNTLTYVATPVY